MLPATACECVHHRSSCAGKPGGNKQTIMSACLRMHTNICMYVTSPDRGLRGRREDLPGAAAATPAAAAPAAASMPP